MRTYLAGAGGGILAVLVAMGMWFVLPMLAPHIVLDYSSWAAPAVRAASCIAARDALDGSAALAWWASVSPQRCARLAPYVVADGQARLLVVEALAGMPGGEQRPPAIEAAVRLLLADGDPRVRRGAAEALSAVSSIAALEAHQSDVDAGVAAAIEEKLYYLRALRRSLE